MQKEEILRLIKETIAKTIPSGAKVILFGSQARGDAREDLDRSEEHTSELQSHA